MRGVAAIALMVGCWTGSANAPTAEPPASPYDVALAWVRALLNDDPRRAELLSDVPFSFDRKRIESRADLHVALITAAAKASSRHHEIDRAEVVVRGDLDSLFPVLTNNHILVEVSVDRDKVLVLVQREQARVVGFRD